MQPYTRNSFTYNLHRTIGEQQKQVENRTKKPDRERTRAVVSVEGHDVDGGSGSGGRRYQRDGVPLTDLENSKQRELESRELEGEELGRDSRAEERAAFPRGRQAAGVVGVEVGEEVRLAAGGPTDIMLLSIASVWSLNSDSE
ncbi:hypothetical protein RHGRI_010045 [Rhododendron griersonianum]|uniref:Uncharacterized protein n=1 Tax=Rhododendron griersonianum TaxID=479676 RepID=A0AAV6KHA9_9ERIC|nr:hypothetical protein RHGRI_010045 [Rhododendron griersonianum]